jgi:hypothetical protein
MVWFTSESAFFTQVSEQMRVWLFFSILTFTPPQNKLFVWLKVIYGIFRPKSKNKWLFTLRFPKFFFSSLATSSTSALYGIANLFDIVKCSWKGILIRILLLWMFLCQFWVEIWFFLFDEKFCFREELRDWSCGSVHKFQEFLNYFTLHLFKQHIEILIRWRHAETIPGIIFCTKKVFPLQVKQFSKWTSIVEMNFFRWCQCSF